MGERGKGLDACSQKPKTISINHMLWCALSVQVVVGGGLGIRIGMMRKTAWKVMTRGKNIGKWAFLFL